MLNTYRSGIFLGSEKTHYSVAGAGGLEVERAGGGGVRWGIFVFISNRNLVTKLQYINIKYIQLFQLRCRGRMHLTSSSWLLFEAISFAVSNSCSDSLVVVLAC